MELFAKIVNGLLRTVAKIFSWMLGWYLDSRLYVFSSYMRLHQLVHYANLTIVNNLD